MNRLYLYMAFFVLLFTSCSDDNADDLKNTDYSSLYDEFVMQYSSLDSLSHLTNASKEMLVGMRYGLINEESDLTETLREVVLACRLKDTDKLNAIKKDKKELNGSLDEISIDRGLYNSINIARNQEFGEILPEIISNFVSEKADEYIENKFTFLNLLLILGITTPNLMKILRKTS